MARRAQRQKAPKSKGHRSPSPPTEAQAPRVDAEPRRRQPTTLVDEPRFWFGFSLPWAKIALVRFALFGVLATDAFLALRHAPRYGTGFNVAHFHFLDGLAPGRAMFTFLELWLVYLFALFALGVGTRLMPLAAMIYGWIYFSSQLDSYQHHYLVFLVLVLACFAPWRRTDRDETSTRSWALRLVLVQLGIVYAWAATAKLAAGWLDGTALHLQLDPMGVLDPDRPHALSFVARQVEHLHGTWATAAKVSLAVELFLAVAVWCRPLWWVALPLGIAFHVGIELSGLQIGLFSYVMFALYMLALPDAIVVGAAHAIARASGAFADRLRAIGAGIGDWPLLAPALLVIAALLAIATARVAVAPAIFVVAVTAGALIGAIVARVRLGPSAAARVLAANLAVAALFAVADRTTTVSYDYYRFWADSSKRFGHPDDARTCYERMIEIAPHAAKPQLELAALDLDAGNGGAALVHWDAAEDADPHDARAYLAEARWLVAQNRGDEALGAAIAAVIANPGNADARALAGALAHPDRAPAAPKPPAADGPDAPAAPDAPDADDH